MIPVVWEFSAMANPTQYIGIGVALILRKRRETSNACTVLFWACKFSSGQKTEKKCIEATIYILFFFLHAQYILLNALQKLIML